MTMTDEDPRVQAMLDQMEARNKANRDAVATALRDHLRQCGTIEDAKASYVRTSIRYGYRDREFAWLPQVVRSRLRKLMARISEQSYRRGFQQGHHFASTGKPIAHDLHDWRYQTPTDVSQFVEARGSWARMPASQRLKIECGFALDSIGLRDD
jgi:hypothetical protein